MDEHENWRSDQADLETETSDLGQGPDPADLEAEADDLAELATLEGNRAAAEALEEVEAPVAASDEPPPEQAEDLEQQAETLPPEPDTLSEVEEESTVPADVGAPAEEEAPAAEAEALADVEAEAPAQVEAEAPAQVEAKAPAAAPAAADDGAVDLEERGLSPFDSPGDWYVVHTYAGYENKVKANLHSRIGSMQMEEKIFDVVIPMEDVMEIKGGRKQVVQKKVFPGYLLVKMIYDNDSWYVVRNTPGVTGFVSSGTGTKPTPLSRREVEKILAVKEETQVKPQYRLEWEEGDVVRIITGPFADFQGTIAEINVEQSKLKVLVNIFDRETPVELAFDQVAKA